MKTGIYTNLTKDVDLEVTKTLVKLLKNSGVDFYLFHNLAASFIGEKTFGPDNYSFLELMITVGGDGTVLNVVKDCVKADIPMLTINKGTKGFLNEIELYNIERMIDIINGDYRVDERILISVALKNKTYLALNEAFVSRNVSKMIMLESRIGGLVADKYSCDGLLVCTPTGSTAYSLSAGGPIISPNASVMCITPVCSHCMHSRPIVVGDNESVEVVLGADYDDAVLTVDGVVADSVGASDVILIKKATQKIRFLRLKESSFYSKLLDKLHGLV